MTIDVIEVKRRLKALLNDNNLVNEYIRQFGPTLDIKYVKIVKEKKAKAARSTEAGQGNDPVFEIKVNCPVCSQADIISYELRAKSQQVLPNKFLVPCYAGAMGYRTVDYTMLSVTVCPRCLFASPDKKDFARANPSGAGELKSQLTSNLIMILQERIGERRALLKYISDYNAYFKRPRTEDAGIASYRLAMSRANAEAWFEQPYSFYKLGSYALRIAKVIKDGGGDNRELLRDALSFFKESFRTSNCPAEEIEMQVIYSIIALCIKLGDQRQANSYIGVFTNLKNARVVEMKTSAAVNTMCIERWQEKARMLWEDRDRDDLFKNE
jgi:uncharacterized protein (DUF2225 family)